MSCKKENQISLLKWKKDLDFGKEGEEMARRFLEKKFGMYFIRYENSKSHDIEMREPKFGSNLWFEVKRDRYDSGNMVVEYGNKYGPTGISTSLSHFWISYFEDTQEFWIIETAKLRRLINSQNQKKGVFWKGRGGDGGNTYMYFLKRACYHHHFNIYKNINGNFMRVYWHKVEGVKPLTIYYKDSTGETETNPERNSTHSGTHITPFIEVPQPEGSREVFRPISL